MSISVTRLDHVAIAADNVSAMAAWYGTVLGLEVVVEAGPNPPQTQKVFLIGPASGKGIAGGMMIEVMPRNETVRHERNSHEPGLSHVAFAVADFAAALGHLRSCQVRFLSEVIEAIGGGRLISFADLEGNMLQIIERN